MIRFVVPSPAGAHRPFVTPGQVARTMLRGDIVTMNANDDRIRDGLLCIEGHWIVGVVANGDPLPRGFDGVAPIDTGGTLFPGLIDLHNHLDYAMMPLWAVPRRFGNRYQWRANDAYKVAVTRPQSLLRDADPQYRRAIARFAECRNLLGGATTGQGMTATRGAARRHFEGLMRNVEKPLDPEWPAVRTELDEYRPAEDAHRQLVEALDRGGPFLYHLSEGTDESSHQHFLNMRAADVPRDLLSRLIVIHGVALREGDFPLLRDAAGLVWSPTSNLLLYGATTDVGRARNEGVSIAIGADWAPSGCKNLLGELKIAQAVARVNGYPFTAKDLVAMVTTVPARMIGWSQWIGALTPNRRADVVVLEGRHDDPWQALIDAREDSLRAVLIDGRIRLGQAGDFTEGVDQCEPIRIGDKSYLLDLTEIQIDGLGGMPLSASIERLRAGLQDLPTLAAKARLRLAATAGAALAAATAGVAGFGPAGDDSPVWDLDAEPGFEIEPGTIPDAAEPGFAPLRKTSPDELLARIVSMELEPITEVDDPKFRDRLRANPNLPDQIKEALAPR